MRKQFSLEKYRHMWKGTRWLAANMLAWDNDGLIMPEELDTLPPNFPQLPGAEDRSIAIDTAGVKGQK